MKSFRPIFILIVILMSVATQAEERVVINDNIEATVQSGLIPITINCDDPILGSMVRTALNAHGALSIRNGSSVKLNIGRTALTAAIACDNPRFTFQTTVEGRDEEDLALRVADAAVVGLGRAWQLKPMYRNTKITFTSAFSGHSEIYTTNLIYSRTRRITDYKNTSLSPHWSPDGGRIYFVSSVRTGFPEIFSTQGTGDLQKIITDVRGALGGASCSPDGRIAFASSNKGSMDIFIAGAGGEGPRRVISTADVDADPSWSPDGSQIVLTSGPIGRPGIYFSSSTGGPLTRLSTGYGYCTEPRWNPIDAAQIVFTFQSGRLGLAVANIKAGVITAVPTTSPLSFSHASWCADGRHVIATQATKTTSCLVIVDTKTGKTTRLTDAKMGNCAEPDCWVGRN